MPTSEEIEEKKDRLKRPNLSLATTLELIRELEGRVIGQGVGDWRPVNQQGDEPDHYIQIDGDSEPYEEEKEA